MKLKRFLSLVIALAMIISLLPAVSAGSETETNNISMTYDLKTLLNAPFAPKYPLTNLTYQLTGGLFKFAESSLANDAPDGSPFWYGGVANSRFFKMNNNEFVSFEISIPKDGEYSMDVTHQRAKNGTTVDVYITDAKTFYDAPFTVAKAADFDLYGSYDTYNSAGANDFAGSNTDWITSEDVFAGEKLSAGKYVITFHVSNVANKRGCVSTFSLTAGDGSEVTLVNTLIDSFENDKVNLSAYKTDGSILDIAEVDISYESDDEAVATVDDEGNITKYKPGYYVITFKVNGSGSASSKFGSVGSFKLRSGGDAALLGTVKDEASGEYQYIAASIEEKEITYHEVENFPTTQLSVQVKNLDGTVDEEKTANIKATFRPNDRAVAGVDKAGIVTGYSEGKTDIYIDATYGEQTFAGSLAVSVFDDTGVKNAYIDVPSEIYEREKIKAELVAVMNSGDEVLVPVENTIFFSEDTSVLRADEDGMLTGIKDGKTKIRFSTKETFRGSELDKEMEITVSIHEGKKASTWYTTEKRENALENISKYSWAKSTMKTAVNTADTYLANYEKWYELIQGEGVPRSRLVSQYGDDFSNICRYCGADVEGEYGRNGSDGFTVDPISRPWKIQCPACKRLFPSNEFDKFYELGVDDQGYFNLEEAYRKHKELFADEYAKSGYADQGYGHLKNVLYPEIGDEQSINNGQGLRPGETVEGWGVDDSYGYLPKDENGNNYQMTSGGTGKVTERHAYVAYYNYRASVKPITAAYALAEAYLYTGDEKYGRAGAILLDRIADTYESYDFSLQNKKADGYIFWGADGGGNLGKYVGHITDAEPHAHNLAKACDILYPMIKDSGVINFLHEKAGEDEMNLENDKKSSEKIWDNWANGILKEIYTAATEMKVQGNFALGQTAVTMAAIALDNEPETTEMIEWVLRTGDNGTGGNVLTKIVDQVDRDGLGNETSDNYNGMWINSVNAIAEYLTVYKGRETYNIFAHPKFAQMYSPFKDRVSLNNQTVNIGDNSNTAELNINVSLATFVNGFKYLKDTPLGKDLAQYIYFRNGFSVKDLKYSILDKNPERVQDEILALGVEDNPAQDSDMQAGYGFAILRDGAKHASASSATETNSLRDLWMHFGKTGGHGHTDLMNISVGAFGLNLTPDLGYPAITGTDPERLQWTNATLSHNTVMVGDASQDAITETLGRPAHFDDAGAVKLIDADGPRAYKDTDIYRRTLVMVEVNDDVSYGVDFFRVRGGNKHTFSFHGQAENAYGVEGLDGMVKQAAEAAGEYELSFWNNAGKFVTEKVHKEA